MCVARKSHVCHLTCLWLALYMVRLPGICLDVRPPEVRMKAYSLAGKLLASFPGPREWAGRKEPGTHYLRMLSFPRISGNLEISRKTCSVTPISAKTPTFLV